MMYSSKASSTLKDQASISIKESEIEFGITPDSADLLPNPAELFLGSISACSLKNVERFSSLMNFDYEKAELTRLRKPLRMDDISYESIVYSQNPSLNIKSLQ